MDRAYVDFERLFIFTLCSAFFVVRAKTNVVLQRRYSHPVDRLTGLRSDHTVILAAVNIGKPLERILWQQEAGRFERWADRLPMRRLGVYGTVLIFIGFLLESLEHWLVLFDIPIT